MNKRIDYRIQTSWPFKIGLLLFGMVLVVFEVSAAVIQVNPDRNPVRLNESFTLTFTANASPDDDPDFSGLEQDFEVLNQSQGSNISVINDDFSKSVTWTLTLMARKTGRLSVPPIPFGQDRSPAIQIEVLDAVSSNPSEDTELILESSASPENPYIEAQVIYTVQFLRRVELAQASLTEPVLENAIIQKLDDDRNFTVHRNGYQYAVTERKYAIFPQASGPVAIPPLELTADVLTSRAFGFFNQQSTRKRRIQSQTLNLEVRPVPAQFKGDYWFPAEQVLLEDQWSNNPPAIQVGEPLTRTLKLTATGTPLSLVPEFGKLRFTGRDGDAFKQYPDQPVLDEKKYFSGIVASREQKLALIPSIPGTFHAEALEIAWWNTRSDRLEIARLPEITIHALPSVASSIPNPAEPVSKPDEANPVSSQSPDIHSFGPAGAETRDPIWFRVSVFLALGWAGTLLMLAWKKFSLNRATKPSEAPETTSARHAVRALKKVCLDNAPQAAKDAFLGWAALRWPDSPPGNLDALARMCEAELGQKIRSLSQLLYSRKGGVWNGTACWEAFSKYAEQPPKQKQKGRGVDLEPLFKA
ncbi:MAG: BatD family protein [Methylococcales bacterium]